MLAAASRAHSPAFACRWAFPQLPAALLQRRTLLATSRPPRTAAAAVAAATPTQANQRPLQQQQQQQQAPASAGLHSGTPQAVRDLDRLQLNVEKKLGLPREFYESAGGLRVRQHVNPLQKELQIPTEPPVWGEAYASSSRPLVLDIGCGYGRFLLALSKTMPGHNMLGLEIRGPIIERANKWTASLGLQESVLFLRGNATITLDHTLSSYPGPIDLVCVQFPDPHFKNRHRKRHTVQAQLVEALSRLLAPGARVFLQSDVLQVAEYMRDTFEQQGSAWFAPCQDLHSGPTFQATSPPKPAAQQAQQAQQQQLGAASGAEQQQPEAAAAETAAAAGAVSEPQQQQEQQQEGEQGGKGQGQQGQQQQEEAQWQSQWAAAGWLEVNPLGVPTEREVLTVAKEQPVYRIMLTRL